MEGQHSLSLEKGKGVITKDAGLLEYTVHKECCGKDHQRCFQLSLCHLVGTLYII